MYVCVSWYECGSGSGSACGCGCVCVCECDVRVLILTGETEAIINFMWTYIRHVKFGDGFNAAFNGGQTHSNYEPDDAAVHWMITPNFRDGKEMDHSNTEYDEFRYQHRGYGKYADIVRLFGWEAFTSFYHQESLDYNAACPEAAHGCQVQRQDGLHETDSRTLRLSLAAGEDISPLIHFWGIPPEEPEKLQNAMEAAGLVGSSKVRCLLLRYDTLIPRNNSQFNDFFEKIHPGRVNDGTENPLYGRGWYNVWRDAYSASHAEAALARLHSFLDLYYPSGICNGQSACLPCDGITTGAPGDPDPVRPQTYSWLQTQEHETQDAGEGGDERGYVEGEVLMGLEWVVNVSIIETRARRPQLVQAPLSQAGSNSGSSAAEADLELGGAGGGADTICARIVVYDASSATEKDMSGLLVLRTDLLGGAVQPVASSNVVCGEPGIGDETAGTLLLVMNETSHPSVWNRLRARVRHRQVSLIRVRHVQTSMCKRPCLCTYTEGSVHIDVQIRAFDVGSYWHACV